MANGVVIPQALVSCSIIDLRQCSACARAAGGSQPGAAVPFAVAELSRWRRERPESAPIHTVRDSDIQAASQPSSQMPFSRELALEMILGAALASGANLQPPALPCGIDAEDEAWLAKAFAAHVQQSRSQGQKSTSGTMSASIELSSRRWTPGLPLTLQPTIRLETGAEDMMQLAANLWFSVRRMLWFLVMSSLILIG